MIDQCITHRTEDDVDLRVNLDAHGLTIEVGNRYSVILDTAHGVKVYLHDAIVPEADCIEVVELDEIFAAAGA